MAQVKDSQNDDIDLHYKDKFEGNQYLSQYYNIPGTPQNYYRDVRLKLVHDMFKKLLPDEEVEGKDDFRVLDYGSGPVIAYVISAAGKRKVSEIVLAEYTEKNRDALNKWQANDSSSFNWLPYIKNVVQDIEKKPESEVRIREQRLRDLMKVVSCDIKAEQPIEKGSEGPFDVVITFLAIECACVSEAEYIEFIEKLSKMVKPNGAIIMFSKLAKKAQSISYAIGRERFYYYAVTYDMLLNALSKAGFVNVQCTNVPIMEAIYHS